ncbi:MAG: iron-containing alcohol dehydrogenase [Methanobacteriota archaeon]
MLDFEYNVSTKVLFGRNKVERLGVEFAGYPENILLVSGGGSIRKTGLYDKVARILKAQGIVYYELSGVKPNPSILSVREGIRICKKHDIGFLLAVGGGSVIDCTKAIAAGVYYLGDPWELFLQGDSKIQKALPLGTVLTIAGTGSEMNGNAVVTNEETGQKLAIHRDLLRPRFSILDPTVTFTVPRGQTAAGVVDICSHVLEQYCSQTKEAYVQDRLSEALLKTVIHFGPVALRKPSDYEARANLMWASSLALNGLLGYGRVTDWATHGIEHAVSAVYDVTHGVGLAILTPVWMEYVLGKNTQWKFVEYAKNVWGVHGGDEKEIAERGIQKTKEFFSHLGMPQRLRDVGVQKEKLGDMARSIVVFGDIGRFQKLGESDVLKILEAAF